MAKGGDGGGGGGWWVGTKTNSIILFYLLIKIPFWCCIFLFWFYPIFKSYKAF